MKHKPSQKLMHILELGLVKLLIILSPGNLFAQPWPYDIVSSTAPYNDLINPVSLNNGSVWTTTSLFSIPFNNFNFSVTESVVDSIDVFAGTGVLFHGAPNYFLYGYSTVVGGTNGSVLIDKGTNISMSPIGYEFSGPPNSQILKIEWKNAGFLTGFWPADTTAYANYQLWLFESDNHMEIHYGPKNDNSVMLPYQGSFIRFMCLGTYGVYISQNQANPYLLWTDFNFPNYSPLTGTPDNGRVFTITPNPLFTGVADIPLVKNVMVAPNPFVSECTIRLEPDGKLADFSLFDSFGRKIQADFIITQNEIQLKRSDLRSGLYLFKLTEEEGVSHSGKLLLLDY